MVVDGRRRWWGLLVAVLVVVLVAACTTIPGSEPEPSPSARAAPGWREGTPESQGFDPVALADAARAVRAADLPVHAVVVVRDGAVVLDASYYPYDGTTPHAVGAITRTVLTTLLGIAVDRGIVAMDDPVVSFFPDRSIANRDARKERVTLRHLASQTSGLDCRAANDEARLRAMTTSADWVGFALDLPVTSEPGTTFHACSVAMHLLSAVLQTATGVTALEFARQFVFEPLGISDVRWTADPQGYQHGWSDLFLLPGDLAKFGQMWIDGGRWRSREIVSDAWARAATHAQVVTGGASDYGFGWWLPQGATAGTLEAVGHGGQSLVVRPDLGLVVVTAGSGIDPSQVTDPMLAALVSPGAPLLSDPPGTASLAAALEEVREAPEAITLRSPASTVKSVSGVTWTLGDNPIGLASLRLALKRAADAGTVRMTFRDGPIEQVVPVGLDGRFRLGLDRYRRPIAIRGEWVEGRTFVLEVDETAEGHAYTLRLTFAKDGETVAVEGLEAGHSGGFAVEGTAAR